MVIRDWGESHDRTSLMASTTASTADRIPDHRSLAASAAPPGSVSVGVGVAGPDVNESVGVADDCVVVGVAVEVAVSVGVDLGVVVGVSE